MTTSTLRTSDGCVVGYDVQGPPGAETVVLLHALGLDRSLWDELTPTLARDRQVVRLDLRGHGASLVPERQWSAADLGADVIAVLDRLGVERAHVAGISLGGLVTLWLGIHRPERVRTLVPANTAARIGTLETWTDRIATVTAHGLGPMVDAAPARWFTREFLSANAPRAETHIARLRTTPVDGYLGACALLRDADLRDAAPRIVAPTVVIGGTGDVATPPADAEWLASAIPGAALRLLQAGHLSNVERPTEFLAAMRLVFG